ncbi:MAG: SMP-30/gluconolactonase/LRE family protein [Clostridia bacterium]|nr:SMP-30/gluconolactonase/LRE family protein [Clostridia bacterium]
MSSGKGNTKKFEIKVTSLLIIIVGTIILLGGILYYLFVPREEKNVSVDILPSFLDVVSPHFLFNIHGAIGVKLLRPMDVYYDEKDRLIIISNTEGHTIEVFKEQGEHLFTFGGFGSEPGKLSFPYGVVRTLKGDYLVAEAGNRRIQRFSATGEYLGTILNQPNNYNIEKPGPLKIDSQGNIYIGDLSGNKVVVLDQQGKIIETFTGVLYPHGIAVDEKNNRLFVASSGTGEIKIFPLGRQKNEQDTLLTENLLAYSKSNLGIIRGLSVDKEGRLFIVDSLLGNITIFDENGVILNSFGGPGNDNGNMLYPNGIYVDDSRRVYIADWANNRIVVWGY